MRGPQDFSTSFKTRFRFVAASCAFALLLSLAVSLLLPKKYTATAQILIQAPGGNDPRAATAISPVYLESLRAYEHLASSDSLFARALDHVHENSQGNGRTIEARKKSILRVSKPANTAILEISASTTDPRKSQALAQFIAEQTVALSNDIDSQTERDTTREYKKQLDAATTRLTQSRDAEAALSREKPVAGLETELAGNAQLLLSIDKALSQARTELAGYTVDQRLAAESGSADDLHDARRNVEACEARIASLSAQRADLTASIASQERRLEEQKTASAQLEAQQSSAQAAFDAASERLNQVLTTGSYRGERLRVIDPGIIPQEPSSPNVALNVLASLVLSVLASLAWIAFASSRAHERSAHLSAAEDGERLFSFRH